MIQFPCVCDHLFTVEDDQVGADIQCPDCGRLNSVPSAADLALLDSEGNYKIDGPIGPERVNHQREEELKRIFKNSRVDEFGQEIDLRSYTQPDDYTRVGVDPLDLVAEGRDRPAAPKYDPETGELIRPIEVQKDTQHVRSTRPAPRRSRIRTPFTRLVHVSPVGIFLSLFKPMNLIVIVLIMFAHLLYAFMGTIMMFGMFIIMLGPLFLIIALVAHFGNVIDETGPSGQDELPRPLRNVSWHDDLWGPFSGMMIGFVYCFGLPLVAMKLSLPLNMKLAIAAPMALFGIFVAPAVILISTTSGSIANLRPDRVLGTAREIGPTYATLLFLFLISVPPYVLGVVGVNLWIFQWFIFKSMQLPQPIFAQAYVAAPLLMVGIFMMHWFCWTLGQTYRVYHRYLPWVHQGPLRDEENQLVPERRGFAVLPPGKQPAPPPKVLKAIPLPPVASRGQKRE